MAAAPLPPTPPPHHLIAAIDLGTNSFKLLLALSHLHALFLPLHRLKSPVLLGRSPSDALTPAALLRAAAALRSFSSLLRPLSPLPLRVVATAAARNAPNRADLISLVRAELGLNADVEILSGEEEARLTYRGVLQFLPLYDKSILTVDIGGGSTEFVVGHKGEVLFAASLNIGHVSLTESFVNADEIRQHVRTVLQQSDVVDKVRELKFEVAVGSSGTIRAIERAVSGGVLGEWRFSREQLGILVEKLTSVCSMEVDGVRRLGFSRRRAEFIVAGAVLLLEIFDALGIGVMEVSGYALGEGVVSEMLARDTPGYNLNVNERWQSVVALAVRCDSENRMNSAVQCLSIAKEIFDGVRKCCEFGEYKSSYAACLDEKDSEYLEAAILLHNTGLMFGQKGYHKVSYKIIKAYLIVRILVYYFMLSKYFILQNGAHLHGYSSDEIEIVALLARFHRKKFPTYVHKSLLNLSGEVKLKFRAMCVIIRVSHALQQCQCPNSRGLEVSFGREGFRLGLSGLKDQQLVSEGAKRISATVDAELQSELEHFEEVFQQKLLISDTC